MKPTSSRSAPSRPASIRTRILVGTGLGVVVAFLATGVTIYLLMRDNAVTQLEDAVGARARALALLVETDADQLDSDISERTIPELEAGGPHLYQLWDAAGRVVERSPSLGDHDLARRGPASSGSPSIERVTLPDGSPGVQATLRFVAAPDGNSPGTRPLSAVLAFARDTVDLERSLADLRSVLVIAGVMATLACLGLLAWIARFGLRPLRTLADQIASVDLDNPASRFDTAVLPSELGPVVARLDELLGRLREAMARERALTADVAHELRTPLAGLKATLQLALSRDRDPARYRAAMQTCLGICEQTARMIEALLALARLDDLARSSVSIRCSIRAVIEEALASANARLAERAIAVELDVADACVEADRDRLRLVIDNLIDNAIVHGDGERLQVSVRPTSGIVTIRVANTGSAVAHQDAPRVFERFWRADAARSVGDHAGLGLALCHRLVGLLGGTITAASTPTSGTERGEFSIAFALATARDTQTGNDHQDHS